MLLSLVASGSAWRLKADDTDKLKKEAEATRVQDLEAFVEGDAEARRPLYQVPRDILAQVQANNKKVLGALEPVEGLMVKLAEGTRFHFLRMRALALITSFIDGNRDNFSYYKLDAVVQWAEERLKSVTEGPDAELLAQLRDKAAEARDALDSMAQAFVKGVKEIKAQTTRGGKEDDAVIQETANAIVEKSQRNKPILTEDVADAIELVDQRLAQ